MFSLSTFVLFYMFSSEVGFTDANQLKTALSIYTVGKMCFVPSWVKVFFSFPAIG